MKIVTAGQAIQYALGRPARLVEASDYHIAVTLGYCWMIAGITFIFGGVIGFVVARLS